jgi:hypothetical protein
VTISKETKLLKRVRDTLRELKESHYDLYCDIQTVLDKPNKAREIELLKKAQNILHVLKMTYYVHVLYWDIKSTLETKHDRSRENNL